MEKHTYLEIASNRNLWSIYVDPAGHTTDDEWNNTTPTERVQFIAECFGAERGTL